MRIISTNIPGCFEIFPQPMRDERGVFIKTYQENIFAEHGLTTRFTEEFYTSSYKGVLRGLHFQTPPMELVKMVYCVSGRVFDAVVDLRKGSPAYGKYFMCELGAEKANMLYLPAGLAHGFFVLSENAILMYRVTAVHSPAHDSGIRWNSAGIPWPDEHPVLSRRDREFISLSDFKSPFTFKEG
jgi:dTDP-4-dehydrorhamnose 3,5-epimerase